MITMTLDETWDLIRDLNAEAHEAARDEWEQADLLEEEGDLDGAEEQREEASYYQASTFRELVDELPQEEHQSILYWEKENKNFREEFNAWWGQ